MAGDWLKFEISTPEKPEVLSITVAMGWDDPDLTVGKLLRVWRWFDQHSEDGNARSVTTALLDRIIGVTGFCDAMAKVGWLAVTEHGICLPNFSRHNGKTAKNRSLTAKRVAAHKSNARGNDEGNAGSVSGALPREEKRREEKEENNMPGNPGPGSSATHINEAKPSEAFMRFWDAWPNTARKTDRKKCWDKWKSRKYDAIADSIVAHVEMSKASNENWRTGYEPAPLTYLNGERWNDGVEPQQAQMARRGLVL